MSSFGNRVHSKRTEKGLTLEEVGKAVGVQKSAVSKWEKGAVANVSYETLTKLASVLGCSTDWLYGGEEVETFKDYTKTLNPQRKEMLQDLYKSKEIEYVMMAYESSSEAEKDIICRILGINRKAFKIGD